ncbi:MAG: COG4315 family predicted lipoprotein [Thermomicrobiales bacterium]|jgi:predicted lipoprotein with Yx(FWY)xxD motif
MKRLLLFVGLIGAMLLSGPALAATTTVGTHDDARLGTILVDGKGMTLYLFTKDEKGKSTCYDTCAANWPPLTAEEPLTLPDGVEGTLTLIDRTDGTKQVAYNDIPLYLWVKDTKPGDTTGQDVGEVWYVVHPGQVFGENPEASPMASPESSPAA